MPRATDDEAAARACAETALDAGREIRALVHAMDPRTRGEPRTPLLKPSGGYGAGTSMPLRRRSDWRGSRSSRAPSAAPSSC